MNSAPMQITKVRIFEADLRGWIPVSIVADEALSDDRDAINLVRRQAGDCLNIKLTNSSGIFVDFKNKAIAKTVGILCMVGSMTETQLGLAAPIRGAV
jgi:L-alanine-DL-glutamate epimerase-like enolase superfamily enzyme